MGGEWTVRERILAPHQENGQGAAHPGRSVWHRVFRNTLFRTRALCSKGSGDDEGAAFPVSITAAPRTPDAPFRPTGSRPAQASSDSGSVSSSSPRSRPYVH
jgi:hypothetical protein